VGPLAGLKVLDLTDRAGALGARLLADLGADVVRVEPPGGASLRAVPNAHAYYDFNKRQVAIDPASAAGEARLRALAGAADVVIDGRPPGAAPALSELCAGNPAAVQLRVTPFGSTGPRASWRGGDLVCAARGGMVCVNGRPDEPPLQPFGLAAYAAAGLFAAIAALLALHERARSGRGAEIDLSVQAAAAAAVEHATGLLRQTGVPPLRRGTLHWSRGFRIGRALDGWVLHGLLGDWTSLLEWVASDGGAEELRDPRFESVDERKAACELLFDRMDAWAARRPVAEIVEGAALRRLSHAAVRPPAELATDPQLAARDFAVTVPETDPSLRLPGAPFRLARTPWRFRRAAAAVGGDDRAVAADPAWQRAPEVPPRAAWQRVTDNRSRAEPSPPSSAARRPLDGVTVLDFTWVVAGPVATRILADHGARVIKVEHPRAPDFGTRRGGLTGNLNRGKQSVVLDMSHASARALALELAARSDVVIDNFSARVMPGWGLGDAVLRALRSDPVVVHMAGFGHGGPLRDRVSYGPTLQAMVGLPLLMPAADGAPLGWGYSWSDMAAGIATALAVLAALWHRRDSGRGQVIDVSQYETLVALLGPGVLEALAGRPPAIPGNGSQEGEAVPHGVFRCAAAPSDGHGAVDDDRWVAIAVADDTEWRRLAGVLARDGEQWAGAEHLATAAGRARARREIEDRLGAWTRARTAAEVERRLQEGGVAAGLVASGADLELDPQLRARGYFAEVPTPEGTREVFDGVPFLSSLAPGRVAAPGPLLGEHTDAVLRDLAGLDAAALAALRAEGAIG
jgi:crotonobetainyl-CoA:carnitine CoA-transferase CaiB-like acyl-CoA transferase